MKRGFSYSILEKSISGLKIIVYTCPVDKLNQLQKSLQSYADENKIENILIKDHRETSWSSIVEYFHKKLRENQDIIDPSFRNDIIFDPPWKEFLPVHVTI